MKRFISLLTVALVLLTGCGNNAPTQKDLENSGFIAFVNDYGSGYKFESADEEYALGIANDSSMLGYLSIFGDSPNEGLEIYIPYNLLGQDITTSSREFVDYYGDNVDEVDFTNDYYGVKQDFENSEYSEQFEIFEQFIVGNFADEKAIDEAFNFQQAVA